MKYTYLILILIAGIVGMWNVGLGMNMLKDSFRPHPLPPKPKEVAENASSE